MILIGRLLKSALLSGKRHIYEYLTYKNIGETNNISHTTSDFTEFRLLLVLIRDINEAGKWKLEKIKIKFWLIFKVMYKKV